MDMDKVTRIKEKAELFLNKDIQAFIKTYNNDFYFCDILVVGEDSILVQSFQGHRSGTQSKIYWMDVQTLEEYEPKDDNSTRFVRGDKEW